MEHKTTVWKTCQALLWASKVVLSEDRAMDILENDHMPRHVFSWHLWPECFWNLDWWLCDNAHLGPNLQQSKPCSHMIWFDCDMSSFLEPWSKRFHDTTCLSGSSELLQRHFKALDDRRVKVMHVLKRNGLWLIDLQYVYHSESKSNTDTHTHNSDYSEIHWLEGIPSAGYMVESLMLWLMRSVCLSALWMVGCYCDKLRCQRGLFR